MYYIIKEVHVRKKPLWLVDLLFQITPSLYREKGSKGYCPKKCVTIISHIFHFVQNYLLSFQHLH